MAQEEDSTPRTAGALIIEVVLAQVLRRWGPGYRLLKTIQVIEAPDGTVEKWEIDAVRYFLARAHEEAERRRAGLEGRTERRPPGPEDARHSPDFSSVWWYGTSYIFVGLQAAAVRLLWEARDNGTPVLSGAYLLENAGSAADPENRRLDLVFRGHAAWGKMIVSAGRGLYRLAGPNEGPTDASEAG